MQQPFQRRKLNENEMKNHSFVGNDEIANQTPKSYSDSLKPEMERIKFKLSKIASIRTRGTIVRSRARWYEHSEINSKYF